MKIAIMQPYFIPYLGYFRLFSETDLFVVYDCVQFPRGSRQSWVHRNRFSNTAGGLGWITLPIKKCPQQTLIKNLEFRNDAAELWHTRTAKYPHIFAELSDNDLAEYINELNGSPLDYITRGLEIICRKLDLHFNIFFSSDMEIPRKYKGKDRLIAICRELNAREYLNAPGGRAIYKKQDFLEHGINLQFLPEFEGDTRSVFERLVFEDREDLKEELKIR